MEPAVLTALIVIGLAFATLLGTICVLLTQVIRQNRQIRELVREYKIFQAAKEGDLTTVRSMKSVFQNGGDKPVAEDSGEKTESAGVTVTQRG